MGTIVAAAPAGSGEPGAAPVSLYAGRVKVGIVVPYSWSFWGAVVEHAELQAEALRELGLDVRTIIGNDPPGSFTRVLHPRLGRHGEPPPDVIPVGRSVIVPANGSLPNLVLSPRTVAADQARARARAVRRPAPARADDARDLRRDARARTLPGRRHLPRVRRARLDALALPFWGFLMDRIDHRIAVSEQARDSAARWLPGDVRDRPERRPDPAGGRPGQPRAPDRLRRAARARARGCRCCCAPGRRPRGDRRAAAADRRRPARRRAAPARASRVRRGDRRARLPHARTS